MLDIEKEYDIVVIDEAQMIADEDRGHSWTRAILGLRVHRHHVDDLPPDAHVRIAFAQLLYRPAADLERQFRPQILQKLSRDDLRFALRQLCHIQTHRKRDHMVQQDKLVQFYFNQYRDSALKLKKKKNDGKSSYEKRVKSLFQELKKPGSEKIKKAKREDYHRQVRNVSYYAFREKNQIAIMEIRDMLLPELVRLDMAELSEREGNGPR